MLSFNFNITLGNLKGQVKDLYRAASAKIESFDVNSVSSNLKSKVEELSSVASAQIESINCIAKEQIGSIANNFDKVKQEMQVHINDFLNKPVDDNCLNEVLNQDHEVEFTGESSAEA